MNLLVYLAGPIDDISTDQARSWRASLAAVLNSLGHVAFDPSAPWLIGRDQLADGAAAIDLGNRQVIRRSAAVIANLAGPGRGWGTIREIEFARSLGIPVLAIVPDDLPTTVALHDLEVLPVETDSDWVSQLNLVAELDEFMVSVVTQLEGVIDRDEGLPSQSASAEGVRRLD